jgi:hypothetical protein
VCCGFAPIAGTAMILDHIRETLGYRGGLFASYLNLGCSHLGSNNINDILNAYFPMLGIERIWAKLEFSTGKPL